MELISAVGVRQALPFGVARQAGQNCQAHQDVLNALALILVTSNWVKQTYIRDGIRGENIEVLPVGCDTDGFAPRFSCKRLRKYQAGTKLIRGLSGLRAT